MKIELRLHGIEPSQSLRDHAVRRIHTQLSRFGQEISAVVVRMSDINGPRRGIDKRCRITLRGRRFSELALDEVSRDSHAAVEGALDRIARVLGRELARARLVRPARTGPRATRRVAVDRRAS